jgi:hypothetical protein
MKASTFVIRALAALLAACALPAGAQFTQDTVSSDTLGDTALGTGALMQVQHYETSSSGVYDTGVGFDAGFSITTGNDNTAFGYRAVYSNETGTGNTGVGSHALYASSASGNTAMGGYALYNSSTGPDNTAVGFAALYSARTGGDNTAVGYQALYSNGAGGTDGNYNTALGALALLGNESGSNNTASGYEALSTNTSGAGNAAVGYQAIHLNKTGSDNSALGMKALSVLTSGARNIAVGFEAGLNLKTGSNDIYIGNPGGTASESGIIRIGALGTHTAAYLQGVAGQVLTGTPAAVYVNPANGLLGVIVSSERYKTDIADMGGASERLAELRPVTFRLLADEQGLRQFGLVAEEVARVYPELAVRDAQGRVQGLRYEELTPMLLNEVQKERQRRSLLETRLAAQEAAIRAQAQSLQALQQQLAQIEELKQAVADLANRGDQANVVGRMSAATPR